MASYHYKLYLSNLNGHNHQFQMTHYDSYTVDCFFFSFLKTVYKLKVYKFIKVFLSFEKYTILYSEHLYFNFSGPHVNPTATCLVGVVSCHARSRVLLASISLANANDVWLSHPCRNYAINHVQVQRRFTFEYDLFIDFILIHFQLDSIPIVISGTPMKRHNHSFKRIT